MAGRSTVETLAQALARFETIGMPARNLATRTRSEYARDLRDLLSYLEQCGTTQVEEVRLRDLEAYLAALDRRGLQGSTRNLAGITETQSGNVRVLRPPLHVTPSASPARCSIASIFTLMCRASHMRN